jgi:hypothetical protein
MGRHSSHQQVDFMKSAFMWFLPWLLAAVVGIGAVWIGVDAALGGDSSGPADEPPARAGAAADPSPSVDATPPETPVEESPPEKENEKPAEKEPKDKQEKKKPRLISDGVRVQILNGTTLSDADDRIASELEALGFEIVATNAWHATPISVVYWSTPEDERTATLLADKLGWVAQPKPEELSTEVQLHVLVGADGTIDLEP